MIRHAAAAALPVVPLAVAVIEPSLPALLVSLVGPPPLFPPCFLSAPVPAVDLPPVAGIADVEHRPATRPATEQPPQHHFSGHRSPARVWTTALCRGTLAWLWSCPLNGAAMKKPRSLPRSGFSLSPLRPCFAGASANLSVEEDSGSRYRRSSENRGFRCVSALDRDSLRQHVFRSELRIGNACRNRRDRGLMMGVG